MDKLFEKIWIDLREFGWGIREVPVIWPDDHKDLTPDSVGTEEIKNGGVRMEDLSPEVTNNIACIGAVVDNVEQTQNNNDNNNF